MIRIKKNPIFPEELTLLQNKCVAESIPKKEAYDSLSGFVKQAVVNSLMEEQGYLCAYCMRRLPDERFVSNDIPRVSIEHIIARNNANSDTATVLDYNNMVAVCSGNVGKRGTRRKSDLTCDAKRGSRDIKINPLDEDTISHVYYSENGEIKSDDEEIQNDLNVKLNLNCMSDTVLLPKFRKEVLDKIQTVLADRADLNEAKNLANTMLRYYENEPNPKTPYIGIAIWWLKGFLD